MFSDYERRMFGKGYFIIIRKEERYMEVMSKNTGHCWMVFKRISDPVKPVVLYHKHKMKDEWYHEHYRTWTVKKAVESIKSHDKYVLDRKVGKYS